MFKIPPEYENLPEAKRLLKLDAELKEAAAEELSAVKGRLFERDPMTYSKLERRVKHLRVELREAVATYDFVTGGPKPVTLPEEVAKLIAAVFPINDEPHVIASLSKILGHLERAGVHDSRVAPYIIKLSKGEMRLFDFYADCAMKNYRDIIVWGEKPP